MEFPPTLEDVSLWLAATAIILLATSELVSPHYRKANLLINSRKLRNVALAIGILFLVAVSLRIYLMVM